MTGEPEAPVSPELETLDQLVGGDLPLRVVRGFYAADAHFARGLSALLRAVEVQLMTDEADLPPWRWREVLADPDSWTEVRVRLTPTGARRIG